MRKHSKTSLGKTSLKLESPTLVRTAADAPGFDFTPKPGHVYTLVRAISARVNRNFDGFRSSELKAAYHTFEGRPVFVNHANSDHKRSRGIILGARYHENGDDKYISLLIEVDGRAFPKLAKEIEEGNIDAVSMGCDVRESHCSYCGNVAVTPQQFCDHVLYHKGQVLHHPQKGATLVYEDCRGLNFFEISYVFDPADETALFENVIVAKVKDASVAKVALDEVTAPPEVDTLREEEICPQCGDDGYDGRSCDFCDYVAPPEELQDPDVDKAREVDIRADQEEESKQDAPLKEGTKRMATNSQALRTALADRRRRQATKRLADLSVVEQQGEEEQIASTPALDAPAVTTEEVMTEEETDNVQSLDGPLVGPELTADDTTDVTKLDVEPTNSVPTTSKRRTVAQILAERKKATDEDLSEGGPGGEDGDGFEGTDAETAEPDARVDVEAPTANTTDDRAQDSQYDVDDYADNQSDNLKDPDLSTDQNWAPKETKVSSMKALMLTERYIQAGLITESEKFNKFAEFEQLSDATVTDRIALLDAVAKVSMRPQPVARPTAAASRPAGLARSVVPRPTATPGRLPSMGRGATRQTVAASDSAADDYTTWV